MKRSPTLMQLFKWGRCANSRSLVRQRYFAEGELPLGAASDAVLPKTALLMPNRAEKSGFSTINCRPRAHWDIFLAVFNGPSVP